MHDGANVETVLIPRVTAGRSDLPSPLTNGTSDDGDGGADFEDADAAAAVDDEDDEDEGAGSGTGTGRRVKEPFIPVTQCISTQVGCAMGCVFCASGVAGLKRHMRADEIIAQVLVGRSRLDANERIRNVVLMGMGEPLHNYDSTVRALKLLTHPDGIALSTRKVTVSTSGLVPEIARLGQDFGGQIGLAISLHAADDETRSRLMPINKKYPLPVLMQALRDYPLPRRRRITIEYTLVAGKNDTVEEARKLTRLLAGPSREGEPDPDEPHRGLDARPAEPRRRARVPAHPRRRRLLVLHPEAPRRRRERRVRSARAPRREAQGAGESDLMRAAARPFWARQSCVLVVALAAVTAVAFAGERSANAAEDEDGVTIVPEKPKPEPDPFRTRPGYVQLFLTTFFGDGLRFNNPYRLVDAARQRCRERVADRAVRRRRASALTFGNPLGYQHGVALRTSAALQGVGQVVMTPSYLGCRRWSALALYGRAGVPIVVTPDVTWGLEAGLGATWYLPRRHRRRGGDGRRRLLRRGHA